MTKKNPFQPLDDFLFFVLLFLTINNLFCLTFTKLLSFGLLSPVGSS